MLLGITSFLISDAIDQLYLFLKFMEIESYNIYSFVWPILLTMFVEFNYDIAHSLIFSFFLLLFNCSFLL